MKNDKKKYTVHSILRLILLIAISFYLSGCNKFVVLQSKGTIGKEESNLILLAILLMLIVVVPVLVLAFWVSVKYKAGNKKTKYMPDWAHSNTLEWLIWMVPVGIVLVLSYFTWIKTYELDPYKPLISNNKPVRVEVVSLDWRWLFIYPDYDIATINQLEFPENTPLEFRLTSATVMTSFFIPQLGSQIYAMAGMQTKLTLIASDTGTFTGQNQEFSGKGYKTMFFEARAVSRDEFYKWVEQVKQSPEKLDLNTFKNLEKPSVNSSVIYYSEVRPGLFDLLINSFMNKS